MIIPSSDIQMASNRVYSEMRQRSEVLSDPATQQSPEEIVDKVTLSQQSPEKSNSISTDGSSNAAVGLQVEVSLYKKALTYQKEMFSQLLNTIDQ